MCPSGSDDVVIETRREYAFRSIYGALYHSFRPNAIGWNVVIWTRRLLLILFSVMLTSLPSAKFLSFVFLHLTICGLHLYYQPFATTKLNEMEQVSIIVHIVMASILTAYPAPTNAAVESAMLTLTIGPLVAYFIYRIAQSYLASNKTHNSIAANVYSKQSNSLNAALLSSSEVEIESMIDEQTRERPLQD